MAQQHTAIVLSTTHWDRAWYLPFQVYRVRLVRLIDRLIKLLDESADFHSFMLDGQMSPVEDYLAIRPERFADLRRLVEQGKLFVGPWYVLADEYLVSPESLIRNLQLGLRMADVYGTVMREGYTPDSFGHIAHLPQILQGFGINSCIFWRGFGDEADELGNEFWWDAPDGSRVLAVHIRDGYHNIANIGYPNRGSDRSAMQLDMELALDQMRAAVDLLKPHAQTSQLLLFDGVDHAEANHDTTHIITQANRLLADVDIVHGTLPDYIANVRAELGDKPLPSISGEFNRGKFAHVLQSVYSTRIYLKQANERVQRLLESLAEPLGAWAWALGHDYPDALLWEAWKLLLRNHPHDDICGCSCDEVHQEDVQRFSEATQIGRTLTRDSFRAIMAHVKCDDQPGIPFVIFNPAGWERSDAVEIDFAFDQNADETSYRFVAADGSPISAQWLDTTDYFEAELRKNHYQRRMRYALQLDRLPALGLQVVYAQPDFPEPPHLVRPLKNGMQNEHLRVTFNLDGTFNIFDLATQQQYSDLGYFLDEADAGDEYDYSPCPDPMHIAQTLLRPAHIEVVEANLMQSTYEVRREWWLPVSLTPDREKRSDETAPLQITMRVTLRGNNRHVDVQVIVENNIRDHRLRIVFPTDIESDVGSADGHFDVITRPIDQPEKPDWVQPPVPTKHQRTFVDVSDGERGLAVFNRGLPEYEIMRSGGRNAVAVTLLRCVDMLFRDDLLTRPGYAWLPLHTPDAQCQGTHTFELAVAPHEGDWRNIYRTAHTWARPVYVRRGDETEGFVPFQAVPQEKDAYQLFKNTVVNPVDLAGNIESGASLLSVEPEQIVLSAVKRSEDGEMLVVRVFNVGDEAVSANLRLAFPIEAAFELNMNEEKHSAISSQQSAVSGQRSAIEVSVGAKQVKTLGFVITRTPPKELGYIG